ncbi:hypothetical protein [Anaerotruncus colihominis]|uniref:hypothetical protein n=1 Tax=Anaerotruncus colihominis TaxID=169435 RepID=UPI00138F8B31|nr:hypothetical protein [Anaerotruncus colihominis]MCR2026864.1 hypothetical protein [Anaerotruncus colihominis]
MTLPAFLKKGLSEKLPTFFEKKVGQKTLVGCAANSGAGSGIYAGCAANSGLGASQLKVFARLFQKAAGEGEGQGPLRVLSFPEGRALIPGRSPHKKRGPRTGRKIPVQTQGFPPAKSVTDAARLAWILQAPAFQPF